jgi:hypothetical protein
LTLCVGHLRGEFTVGLNIARARNADLSNPELGGCALEDFRFDFGVPKNSSGRANQPSIPEVSPQVWKQLLLAADEFNRLAPWTWMHDSQIVGLRDTQTNELLLASILGRLRTMFALLLYRNPAGHRWILNTIVSDGAWGEEDADYALEQDLIKVEFVLKRDLVKEDRAVLAATKYSARLKCGRPWPQFRNMVPGGYPWHLTEREAESLLFALPRVAAVAQLVRQQPRLWDDHADGEIALLPVGFDPAKDQLRVEQIEWVPMIPPPEPQPELVSLDETSLTELLKLKQRRGFRLELDVAYSPIIIGDRDRPYFPKFAMAVDRASGFVGGFRLADAQDRAGAVALRTVLRSSLTQLGARPEAILVQRPRVAGMLAELSTQLQITVLLDEQLDALNAARVHMESVFSARRGT